MAEPELVPKSVTRPRAAPSSRKSTAFAAQQQAPEEVVRWLEYENAQLGAADAEQQAKPARFGRASKQPSMRRRKPSRAQQNAFGANSDKEPVAAETIDADKPSNPSLVNELSARLASLDVGAQRSLLRKLQDLDNNPDQQSNQTFQRSQLVEPEPEPEPEPPVDPDLPVPQKAAKHTTEHETGLAGARSFHGHTQRVCPQTNDVDGEAVIGKVNAWTFISRANEAHLGNMFWVKIQLHEISMPTFSRYALGLQAVVISLTNFWTLCCGNVSPSMF